MNHSNKTFKNEIKALVLAASSVYVLFALLSYDISDSLQVASRNIAVSTNIVGVWGAFISKNLLYYFGLTSYIIPVWLMILSYSVYNESVLKTYLSIGISSLILMYTVSSILTLYVPNFFTLPQGMGGALGLSISWYLVVHSGITGAFIILSLFLLSTIMIVTKTSLINVIKSLHQNFSLQVLLTIKLPKLRKIQKINDPLNVDMGEVNDSVEEIPSIQQKDLISSYIQPHQKPKENKSVNDKDSAENSRRNSYQINSKEKNTDKKIDTVSTIELLNSISDDHNKIDSETLANLSKSVEERLLDFNLNVTVTSVIPGPVVTRFEIKLAAGTKVSKITGLAKDLARSLSVKSVRIVEVIAGKSVIGLELPNPNRQMVSIKSVLSSNEYIHSDLNLPMALGKNISGEPVIVDLSKMPHLLVAGTTGSGKSVGINTILISLLMKLNPQDLRLILIDPKMLELSIYEKIPHLLTPVITDMNDASAGLRWCVAEMERRYQLMSEAGVRNINGYNEKIAKSGETLDEKHQHLPYIVVIADEFADMIMVVGKKVEQLIARLAQKARAAGIHLVLATQRPSVDVITGLIKANVPSRIAFAVSSKIDSRTILDQQGAEQLLGQGDMLYLPTGSGLPVRVHGAFVSDEEVHKVVESIKENSDFEVEEDIIKTSSQLSEDSSLFSNTSESSSEDELYDKAVDIVIKTRKASISNIQRRLRIGYNRAASLVEAMEEAGVVTPMESNGSRQVIAQNSQDDS